MRFQGHDLGNQGTLANGYLVLWLSVDLEVSIEICLSKGQLIPWVIDPRDLRGTIELLLRSSSLKSVISNLKDWRRYNRGFLSCQRDLWVCSNQGLIHQAFMIFEGFVPSFLKEDGFGSGCCFGDIGGLFPLCCRLELVSYLFFGCYWLVFVFWTISVTLFLRFTVQGINCIVLIFWWFGHGATIFVLSLYSHKGLVPVDSRFMVVSLYYSGNLGDWEAANFGRICICPDNYKLLWQYGFLYNIDGDSMCILHNRYLKVWFLCAKTGFGFMSVVSFRLTHHLFHWFWFLVNTKSLLPQCEVVNKAVIYDWLDRNIVLSLFKIRGIEDLVYILLYRQNSARLLVVVRLYGLCTLSLEFKVFLCDNSCSRFKILLSHRYRCWLRFLVMLRCSLVYFEHSHMFGTRCRPRLYLWLRVWIDYYMFMFIIGFGRMSALVELSLMSLWLMQVMYPFQQKLVWHSVIWVSAFWLSHWLDKAFSTLRKVYFLEYRLRVGLERKEKMASVRTQGKVALPKPPFRK